MLEYGNPIQVRYARTWHVEIRSKLVMSEHGNPIQVSYVGTWQSVWLLCVDGPKLISIENLKN